MESPPPPHSKQREEAQSQSPMAESKVATRQFIGNRRRLFEMAGNRRFPIGTFFTICMGSTVLLAFLHGTIAAQASAEYKAGAPPSFSASSSPPQSFSSASKFPLNTVGKANTGQLLKKTEARTKESVSSYQPSAPTSPSMPSLSSSSEGHHHHPHHIMFSDGPFHNSTRFYQFNDNVASKDDNVDNKGDSSSSWQEEDYINSDSLGNTTINEDTNGSSSSMLNSTSTDNYLYDVPVYLVVLLSLLYGAISVVSVIGNVLVLWVVAVSRRMRTKTNMFIANLALSDIIIAIFAIPFQFQAALLQRWNLPDFMCAFCPFVQVLSVNVSVLTLSAIALDRYRAILHPFKAIRISKREALYAVVSIWAVSILVALPQELDYKVIESPDRGVTKPFCAPVILSTNFRQYYMFALVFIQYILPLGIISGAYVRMAAKLWGTNAPGNKEESRDENTLRNKKKVVKMLAVVVLLFALCWLPLQMYNFFQTITTINQYQYINIIWFCFHWLAMSNSCYNPFIYAIYSDKFQTEFKSRLRCFRVRPRDPDDGYCSEASDFGTFGSRVGPTNRSTRVSSNNRAEIIRISTIESHQHRPHYNHRNNSVNKNSGFQENNVANPASVTNSSMNNSTTVSINSVNSNPDKNTKSSNL